MKRIGVCVFLLVMSTAAFAGDAENISACVKKAGDMAGETLDPFAAVYEGNILSMSTAKWNNAFCEVKFGDVYTLQIGDKSVVYKGYAGKESYDLNQNLQAKTDEAVSKLNSRIALLKQRAGQASSSLKLANPNRQWLTQYVDEGIEKALGKSLQ